MVGVLLQHDAYVAVELRDNLRHIADVRHLDLSALRYLDGEVSVKVGNGTSLRVAHHLNGGTDDAFAFLVDHHALHRACGLLCGLHSPFGTGRGDNAQRQTESHTYNNMSFIHS